METKMITIPFEVEKAKKIQAGELPGKIVTRDGYNVRIVCWNRKDDTFPIVALIYSEKQLKEFCECYKVNGRYLTSESEYEKDLLIQIPEWTQFKDGDVLATESGNRFILNADGEFKTSCYVGLFHGKLSFGGAALANEIEAMTYATDEERQELIDALEASTDPCAKEYLKRFFGIEKKEECEFEFLQPVLVRDGEDDCWKYGEFTFERAGTYYINGGINWTSCIPYNEQTKHLLGTTDNWEGEQ